MKKTSKILSIILALMAIISAMIIPASAEAIPYSYLTIEPSSTEVEVGDYVTVDVVVPENSDISVITVDLNYNPSVFEVVSMYSYGMFGNAEYSEITNYAYADGKARFTGVTYGSIKEEGILFTVVLLAIDSSLDSELSLSVTEAINGNIDVMQIFTNKAYICIDEHTNPTLTMVAHKTDLEIGDYVGIDVMVSENSDISAFMVDLVYDPSVFEPDAMFAYGMFNNDGYNTNEKFNMNYAGDKVRFVGATSNSLTEEGVLFTIVFKVVGDATESEIWLSVGEACDSDYNNIYLETNSLYLAVAPEKIYINEPSRTTIRCNDGIVLKSCLSGDVPCIGYVSWSWDNDNFDVEDNGDGTITIISKNNGYTTFTASYIDATGEVFAYDTIEMYSKAGFFDKIGGFFRSLFGTTTIYKY